MLKKRITWLALGLIAALGVGAVAAPPLNLMPVYLWLNGSNVSAANPVPVSSAGAEVATNGDSINTDAWPQAYNYNVDGTLNYEEVTGTPPGGTSGTYRRTYSYSNGKISSITGWVKQ